MSKITLAYANRVSDAAEKLYELLKEDGSERGHGARVVLTTLMTGYFHPTSDDTLNAVVAGALIAGEALDNTEPLDTAP